MNLKPGSLGESQVEWQQNNDWTSQIHRTALTSKGRQKSQASSRCKVCIHLPVASILLIRPATRVSRSCPTNLPSTMSWTCRFFPQEVLQSFHVEDQVVWVWDCHLSLCKKSRANNSQPIILELHPSFLSSQPHPWISPTCIYWTNAWWHLSVMSWKITIIWSLFVVRQNVLFIQSIQMLSWTLD